MTGWRFMALGLMLLLTVLLNERATASLGEPLARQWGFDRVEEIAVRRFSRQHEGRLKGTAVMLTFTEVETERFYDYVSVIDGVCIVAKLTGTEGVNQTYTSTAGSLSVRLTSDGWGEKRGFTAVYRAVPIQPSGPPPVPSPLHMQQEAALRALYRSTGGPTKWLTNWEEQFRHNCSVCGWFGVVCDAAQRMTRLEYGAPDIMSHVPFMLSSNSLHGPMPSEIGFLTSLSVLSLADNSLHGPIPSEIGLLTSLSYLNVGGNAITGTIPESLYSCKKLKRLYLYRNHIEGKISEAVQHFNALTRLRLDTNRLHGSIPESIYKCGNLTQLLLYDNRLTGTLSEAVRGLTHLVLLSLGDNSLGGKIPEPLYTLSTLKFLGLSKNRIEGTVSDAVQHLNALTGLNMAKNRLRGTIPESLCNCSQLSEVSLSNNFLSGSLPSGLDTLKQLYRLELHSNQLHGTIPESLYRCSNLYLLYLWKNHLTGTISESVQYMNALSYLSLGSNRLHGTVPKSLCNCSNLEQLWLQSNSLTGIIPACLGTLNALSTLSLRDNSLSGFIPMVPGGWQSPHAALDLGANQLTGALPSMLSSHLEFLGLDGNNFDGTVSTTLNSMKHLIVVLLSNNSFTGPLPKINSSHLMWALFDRNNFNGPVPWGSLLSSKLEVLSLASNQLSGSIAAQLSNSLTRLLLDNNRFSGRLPSFGKLNRLHTLTVHENQCHGRLQLPQNASALREVFVHNNRGLSCPISVGEHENDTYLRSHNLLLAGNLFSSPIPSWAVMHDEPAMYVASQATGWAERVVYLAIGLPLLFGCVVAVHKTAVLEFFVFKPDQGLEQFQWWSAKAIGIMGVPFLLVMLPLYAEGSNLYECGEAWLKATTITYLSGNIVIEWLVAVLACAAAVAQSCLLVAMRHEVDANFPPAETILHVMPWGAYVKIVLLWSVMLVFFSVPTVLYTLSTALPTENTLGLGATSLELFNQAAAVLLYLVVVIIAPYTAQWLVSKVMVGPADGHACFTTRLVLVTRLMVGVLVPTLVTILFNNECMSLWLDLWTLCADDTSSFDVVVQLQPAVKHHDYFSYVSYFTSFAHPYTITTHSQICQPTWKEQRCSRAVFSVVGDLILSKAAVIAFLTPGGVMLMSMPFVTRAAERAWQRLYPDSEFMWYRGDVELSYVLMFFEYTFIFGFIMPLVLPLMAVGLLMNCAVYRCAVRTLKLPTHDAVQPPITDLSMARVIHFFLLVFFFIDNDLAGKWLLCIGMPVSAIVGHLVASRVWAPSSQCRNTSPLQELTVPLIGPDVGKSQSQGSIEMSDDPLRDAMMDNGVIFKAAEVLDPSPMGAPMESYEINVTRKVSE